MHAGPSTLMAILAHSFHIIRLKTLLRKISRECVKCQRVYARTTKKLMGEFTRGQNSASEAFFQCGSGFAGPMKFNHGIRKAIISKCYVAVLICFITRATHLELVATCLTSQAFIATLDRFTAKRVAPFQTMGPILWGLKLNYKISTN